MPPTSAERDVRTCALRACRRVGLYRDVPSSSSPRFLDRPAVELVGESGAECPIGPPYNDHLLTFRQTFRACLEYKGHARFRIWLQRLCTEDFTWRDFCAYHADRL